MKIELIETKRKSTNEADFTLEIFSTKYYSIQRITKDYHNGERFVSFDIESKLDGAYLPKIYFFDGLFGNKEPHFEIQTTSYGTMELEDFDRFLEAQVVAKGTLIALTEMFIGK